VIGPARTGSGRPAAGSRAGWRGRVLAPREVRQPGRAAWLV